MPAGFGGCGTIATKVGQVCLIVDGAVWAGGSNTGAAAGAFGAGDAAVVGAGAVVAVGVGAGAVVGVGVAVGVGLAVTVASGVAVGLDTATVGDVDGAGVPLSARAKEPPMNSAPAAAIAAPLIRAVFIFIARSIDRSSQIVVPPIRVTTGSGSR